MKQPIQETMSKDLITVGWKETVEAAYHRMQDCRIRHLPVTNERGDVVGILSDRDVQRAMVSILEKGPGRHPRTETVHFEASSRVRDYMSWPVRFVEKSTDLRTVAQLMIKDKVSSVLVCSGARFVGIATSEDLLKVLVQLLSEPGSLAGWNLGHLLDESFTRLGDTLV